MRVFISQPMNGKTDEEINNRRKEIIEAIKNRYLNENIEFIYSVIDDKIDETVNNIPVWYLGKSILLLSTATLVCFDKNWTHARGCKIEHKICEEYNIPTTYLSDLLN